MSSRRSAEGSRDSGISRQAIARPTMPIGTFTKKIQVQSIFSVIRPPITGPIENAAADTAAQMPTAVPRSRGSGNTSLMIASVGGVISAAPTPWRARAAISRAGLGAGQAAAGEQEHGEGEDVGVHDPGEA